MCFKGTDRKSVNGKNRIIDGFNDFPFVVHNLSEYICKKCLTLVNLKRTVLNAGREVKRHRLSLDSIVLVIKANLKDLKDLKDLKANGLEP